jgi:ketosteroid isomerase-like protein
MEAIMDNEQKQKLALKFLSILGKPDASVVKDVAVEDVIWTFPGTAQISGEAHGVDAIMKRAHTIASYKVKVEIVRTVYGFSGVSVILHNTGEKDGKVLDEHLAAVFSFRGDKIERLDTHLSDVPMVKAFFG